MELKNLFAFNAHVLGHEKINTAIQHLIHSSAPVHVAKPPLNTA